MLLQRYVEIPHISLIEICRNVYIKLLLIVKKSVLKCGSQCPIIYLFLAASTLIFLVYNSIQQVLTVSGIKQNFMY